MAFRAFIAVEVPVSLELENFSRAVRDTNADLKMVNLVNVHLTLKFLGDIDKSLVPEIQAVMNHALAGIRPFSMKLRGTGAFPNLNRMSVIWAGMENADPLVTIAEKIDAGLKPLGFQPERRKYSPHVTIARVRAGRNRDRLVDVIARFSDTDFGAVPVSRILLKKSVLTPGGPIYSDIIGVELF